MLFASSRATSSDIGALLISPQGDHKGPNPAPRLSHPYYVPWSGTTRQGDRKGPIPTPRLSRPYYMTQRVSMIHILQRIYRSCGFGTARGFKRRILSDDFHDDAFGALAVEFVAEDALPGSILQ